MSDHIKNKVANPRKERKPNTSVIVVKITAEAKAGSILSLSKTSGIIIPEKPAISKFSIMARPIIKPNSKLSNQ